MHRAGRLLPDDPGGGAPRNTWVAYGTSKLANLLFTAELSRRLAGADLPTGALAAHPGWTRSNLAGSGAALGTSRVRRRLARAAGTTLGQSAAAGALPVLCAATSSSVHSGQYVGPAHLFQLYGPPRLVRPSRRARDEAAASTLWRASEELTGVHYSLRAPSDGSGSTARSRRRLGCPATGSWPAENAAWRGERSGRRTRPSATITTASAPPARRSGGPALGPGAADIGVVEQQDPPASQLRCGARHRVGVGVRAHVAHRGATPSEEPGQPARGRSGTPRRARVRPRPRGASPMGAPTTAPRTRGRTARPRPRRDSRRARPRSRPRSGAAIGAKRARASETGDSL